MAKQPTSENAQTCPHCGYCPHCGRSNPVGVQPYPYVYPQWPYPYWQWSPNTITYGTTVKGGTFTNNATPQFSSVSN